MSTIMKIELDEGYIVLPYLSSSQLTHSVASPQIDAIPTASAPGSPASSMAMASPERTLSLGAVSIASTMPSSAPSVRSSFEAEQGLLSGSTPVAANINANTTTLRGKLILSLTKPTKVASLAICLNGSTHIAFLGTGKRAHYSRHHIRSQQFLIEPKPQSDMYTLLSKDTVAYPFAIEVPNHLPASVTTPQGGTIYRLTAVLTLAKSAGVMSFLSSGTTFTTASTVQIYRAPRPHSQLMEAAATNADEQEDDDVEEEPVVEGGVTQTESQRQPVDENDMMPATVNHLWPGQLETTVTIPFSQLPPQSKPDLRLRVRILHKTMAIKSFQASLWERAVFRVQKEGAPANSKKYIIGVRERIITAQRCESGWVNDAITSQVPHTFEKVVLFSIPNSIRSHNELHSSRSCNVSTNTSILKLKKRQLKEDLEIKDSEFGEIYIEIQHFIRYSVHVTGSVDNKGRTVPSPVERCIGDVPVIVRGLPSGPDCDTTGLPTYLHSFSTSRVSYEEARDYEFEAIGMAPGTDGSEGLYDETGSPGPIYGDYENDDAFMAIMGYRGICTPPSYEDIIERPSLDVSISDLQNMRISDLQVGLGIANSDGETNSGSVSGLTR
ncbi:hypothetical protein EDD21DRAFT_390621 [Dissophora ornata]|nr:hypothetical protein BGZ58_005164 [Dissophora ornata]KAI8595655.1 hypothetical protein EDD21DRAFT_390621 [Dissophora ornata]